MRTITCRSRFLASAPAADADAGAPGTTTALCAQREKGVGSMDVHFISLASNRAASHSTLQKATWSTHPP